MKRKANVPADPHRINALSNPMTNTAPPNNNATKVPIMIQPINFLFVILTSKTFP